jgi:hypothetical protein
VKVYTAAIQLLAAYSQPKYLYGAPGVDANDALYAASNKFLGETSKLGATLLAQCVQHLSAMDKGVSERSTLAFGLFERCGVWRQAAAFWSCGVWWRFAHVAGHLSSRLHAVNLGCCLRRT